MAKKPAQVVVVERAKTELVPAQRDCANYAWAASVESMLKLQDVRIPQQDWVMKSYGGYRCITPIVSYSDLLRYLNGEYNLDKGRRVRIESEYTEGVPSAADSFIVMLREGHPLMLVWNGRPYVWYGLVYDEYIHATGDRLFEMRELKLFDPLAKNKKDQMVSFVKGRDDANQINGYMVVRVVAR